MRPDSADLRRWPAHARSDLVLACEGRHRDEVSLESAIDVPRPRSRRRDTIETRRFISYEDGELLVGWLEDFPAYRTQGETLGEPEVNLSEIYSELSSGRIPGAHNPGEQGYRVARIPACVTCAMVRVQ